MEVPFAVTAEALRALALRERHRLDLLRDLALTGYIAPPSDADFAHWRRLAARLDAGAGILELLAPIEPTVRRLVAGLRLPGAIALPTMWTGQDPLGR